MVLVDNPLKIDISIGIVHVATFSVSVTLFFFGLIHSSAFSAAKAMWHLVEIRDRDTIAYSYD